MTQRPLLFGITSFVALNACLSGVLGCSKKGQEQAATGSSGSSAVAATSKNPIKVDGSSTVFVMSQAAAEDFQKSGAGTVTVGTSGTGGGFKKFCRGEIDVANASRPITASEAEECKKNSVDYVELPVAYDGLAVVVHADNKWVDKLTVAELKAMWEPAAADKVNNWSQIRSGFPDKKLALFGPGTSSGTFDYFTEAVMGKKAASRGDFTSNEDDNVLVQGVAGDSGALGYFGYAYYEANKDKLRLIPIDDSIKENGDGAISPTPDTVANGTYQPLSRPLFLYISSKSIVRSEVAAFAEFYLANARKLSAEVKFVPMPETVDAATKARLKARKMGSMFAGKETTVGITLDALLAAESK